MNTFWTLPTAIEAAIVVLCLVIARFGLRLPVRPAIAALILACPVPLAYLVAGGNSAIFPSDCLGLICLLWLARGHKRFHTLLTDKTARMPVVLAALVLVGLPAISTALGVVSTGAGDWRLIVVGIFRGCAYLGLFAGAMHFGRCSQGVNKLIALQCIAFALICCCGIVQDYTGLDLTLPSPTAGVFQGDLAADSQAGFMGLYRGALGGWGAVMLGVTPLVLFRRTLGWLIAPVCMLAVLAAIILTGSRQGLLIGLMAAVLGTLATLINRGSPAAGNVRALIAVAVLALGGICLLSTEVGGSYDTWFNHRFGSLFDSSGFGDQVTSRDDRMGDALDRWLKNDVPVQMLGAGRGRISDNATIYPEEVGYVDSEILWQLQENGLIMLVAYSIFLIVLAKRFALPTHVTDEARTTILTGRIALTSGILLIYGHFFLLHVQYSQATVAYWNWALIGAVLGSAVRVNCGRYSYSTPVGANVRIPGIQSGAKLAQA